MDEVQVNGYRQQLLDRLDADRPPEGLDLSPAAFARRARAAHRQRTARVLSVAAVVGVAIVAAAVVPGALSSGTVTTNEPAATAPMLAPLRTEVAAPPPPAWVFEPFAALSAGVESNPAALTAVRYDASNDSLVVLATDSAAAHVLIDDVTEQFELPRPVEVEIVQHSRSDLEFMMRQVLEGGEVAGQKVTMGTIDAPRVKFGIFLENVTDEARAALARDYGDAVEVSEGSPTLQPGP